MARLMDLEPQHKNVRLRSHPNARFCLLTTHRCKYLMSNTFSLMTHFISCPRKTCLLSKYLIISISNTTKTSLDNK